MNSPHDSAPTAEHIGEAVDSTSTWSYLTKFVCRDDQLDEAKRRYQQTTNLVREKHSVLLVSEQAYALGQPEPIFTLLLDEIRGFGDAFNDAEKEQFSAFMFVTIVSVKDMDDELLRGIADTLEIDWDEFPARFPSRTRAIRLSESGQESAECVVQ